MEPDLKLIVKALIYFKKFTPCPNFHYYFTITHSLDIFIEVTDIF